MPVTILSKRQSAPEARPSSDVTPRALSRHEWIVVALIIPAVAGIALLSQLVSPSPVVRDVAQFAHLSFVVVGFGSVLAVDWYGVRWQLGMTSLEKVLAAAGMLAAPIWFGLGGLLASGLFLSPDLSSATTLVKIGLVAGAGLVGMAALATHRQLSRTGRFRPPWLVRRALFFAFASQACWWGATVIGFLNRSA